MCREPAIAGRRGGLDGLREDAVSPSSGRQTLDDADVRHELDRSGSSGDSNATAREMRFTPGRRVAAQ